MFSYRSEIVYEWDTGIKKTLTKMFAKTTQSIRLGFVT